MVVVVCVCERERERERERALLGTTVSCTIRLSVRNQYCTYNKKLTFAKVKSALYFCDKLRITGHYVNAQVCKNSRSLLLPSRSLLPLLLR